MKTRTKNATVVRRALILLCGLGGVALIAGCASAPRSKASVSVEQVVEMSKSGTAASSIIGKMQETNTVYRLSGPSVAKLRGQGVPEPVLDYMLRTRWRAEREEADECFRWIWCIRGPPYFVVK